MSQRKNLLECIACVLGQFVWEFNSEVQDHVTSLLWELGQRQPLAAYSLFRSGFDNVSRGNSDGPAVQCGSFDRAATQCLETKGLISRHPSAWPSFDYKHL